MEKRSTRDLATMRSPKNSSCDAWRRRFGTASRIGITPILIKGDTMKFTGWTRILIATMLVAFLGACADTGSSSSSSGKKDSGGSSFPQD